MWHFDHALTAGFKFQRLVGAKRVLSSPKLPDRLWDSPSLLVNGYGFISPRQNGRGLKMTIQLRLVPRLRMSGDMPLLPTYTVMVWTVMVAGWGGGENLLDFYNNNNNYYYY